MCTVQPHPILSYAHQVPPPLKNSMFYLLINKYPDFFIIVVIQLLIDFQSSLHCMQYTFNLQDNFHKTI